MKSNLLHRGTQIVAGIIFLTAALIILLPPNHNFFKSVSVFAPQLMFGLLFLSFIFLVFEQKSLMIIAMLSAALIAFFLKTASNNNLILPLENNSVKTKIVLFNLDDCDPDETNLVEIINEMDVDIIALQEYSQEWDQILNNALIEKYPYAHKLKRDDSFGFAIFTRKKIFKIDNFYYNEIPNLKIAVDNGNGKLTIISSYLPLDYSGKNQRVEEHISKLTEEIKSKLQRRTVVIEHREVEKLVANIETVYREDLRDSTDQNLDQNFQNFIASKEIVNAVTYFYRKDAKRVRKFSKMISLYLSTLRRVNLRDTQIRKRKRTKNFLVQILFLVLGFPMFLFGYVNNYLPFKTLSVILWPTASPAAASLCGKA